MKPRPNFIVADRHLISLAWAAALRVYTSTEVIMVMRYSAVAYEPPLRGAHKRFGIQKLLVELEAVSQE